MKIKTSELTGEALDWAVAKCEGNHITFADGTGHAPAGTPSGQWEMYSSNWSQGGPILESASITIIRANDDYEKDAQGFTTLKRVPVWFAECDQWVGHSLCTSYEGECMEPTFMIGEGGGYYGPTPLIAAMRCYVASKLGDEVEIPDELTLA